MLHSILAYLDTHVAPVFEDTIVEQYAIRPLKALYVEYRHQH